MNWPKPAIVRKRNHALQAFCFVRRRAHHGGHVSGWMRDLAGVAAQFVGVVGHGWASSCARFAAFRARFASALAIRSASCDAFLGGR